MWRKSIWVFRIVLLIAAVLLVVRFVRVQKHTDKIVDAVKHRTFAEVVTNSSQCLLDTGIPMAYCTSRPTPVEDTSIGDIGQALIANVWTSVVRKPVTKHWITSLNIASTAAAFLLLAGLIVLHGFQWSAVAVLLFGASWLQIEHFGVDYRSMALAVFLFGASSVLLLALAYSRLRDSKGFLKYSIPALVLLSLVILIRQPVGISTLVGILALTAMSFLLRKQPMIHAAVAGVALASYNLKDLLCYLRNSIYGLESVLHPTHGTGQVMIVSLGKEAINPWGLRSLFSDGDFIQIAFKKGVDFSYTPKVQALYHRMYVKLAVSEPMEYLNVMFQKLKATLLMETQFFSFLTYSCISAFLLLAYLFFGKTYRSGRMIMLFSIMILIILSAHVQGLLAASEYAYIAEVGFVFFIIAWVELVRQDRLMSFSNLRANLQFFRKPVFLCAPLVLIIGAFGLFKAAQLWVSEPADQVLHAASKGDISALEHSMKEMGATSVDLTDFLQYTPLMKAAASGQVEMMRYLLERGANPNAQNVFKVTPLFQAIWYGHEKAVDLLIQSGANTYAESIGEYHANCFSRSERISQRLTELGVPTKREYCSIRPVNYKMILR